MMEDLELRLVALRDDDVDRRCNALSAGFLGLSMHEDELDERLKVLKQQSENDHLTRARYDVEKEVFEEVVISK